MEVYFIFTNIAIFCARPKPLSCQRKLRSNISIFFLTIEKSFVFVNNDNLVNKTNYASIGFSFSLAPAFLNTAFSPV